MTPIKGTLSAIKFVFFTLFLFPSLFLFASSLGASVTYSVHLGPHGYAPYFIVDKSEKGNVYSGIAHDLLDYFEQQNPGYKRTHLILPRKRVNTMMARGPVLDVMLNSQLFVTSDVLKHYQFTIPLFRSRDVVITRRDQAFEYSSPSDLHGKSVGTIIGYGYGEFDRLFSQGSVDDVRVDSHEQAIGMLVNKRTDAYLGNRFVSPYYMKRMGLNPTDFLLSEIPIYEFDLAFLVNKRKPELLEKLNQFIDQVIADGTRDRIIKQHLN
ncbi:MAG: substrate-binding periplasmic protein [Granulosicoccus sp.]